MWLQVDFLYILQIYIFSKCWYGTHGEYQQQNKHRIDITQWGECWKDGSVGYGTCGQAKGSEFKSQVEGEAQFPHVVFWPPHTWRHIQ